MGRVNHSQMVAFCQPGLLTLQRLLGVDWKDPIAVEPAPIRVWSKSPHVKKTRKKEASINTQSPTISFSIQV